MKNELNKIQEKLTMNKNLSSSVIEINPQLFKRILPPIDDSASRVCLNPHYY